MKGVLAFVFSGVSLFTCVYSWAEVEAWYSYETEWKQFMFWLSVMLPERVLRLGMLHSTLATDGEKYHASRRPGRRTRNFKGGPR